MNWIDMDYMLVTVNLQRESHVLILFSTEAELIEGHGSIRVRVLMNTSTTYPSNIYMTPAISVELCPLSCHRHSLDYGSYSYNFYQPSVPAGNYTIKIQWRLLSLEDGIQGCVRDRALTVLAFPMQWVYHKYHWIFTHNNPAKKDRPQNAQIKPKEKREECLSYCCIVVNSSSCVVLLLEDVKWWYYTNFLSLVSYSLLHKLKD